MDTDLRGVRLNVFQGRASGHTAGVGAGMLSLFLPPTLIQLTIGLVSILTLSKPLAFGEGGGR